MTVRFGANDRIAALHVRDGAAALTPALLQEQRIAEFELLEENHLALSATQAGPFEAVLEADDAAIWLCLQAQDATQARIDLATAPVRAAIQDYRAVCEAYAHAVRDLAPGQIEQLDIERREAHTEGATAIQAALHGTAQVDLATAKRLFSLVSVVTHNTL